MISKQILASEIKPLTRVQGALALALKLQDLSSLATKLVNTLSFEPLWTIKADLYQGIYVKDLDYVSYPYVFISHE